MSYAKPFICKQLSPPNETETNSSSNNTRWHMRHLATFSPRVPFKPPQKTFTAVEKWQLRCHMSFEVGWDCNNNCSPSLSFSVSSFALPLPAFNAAPGLWGEMSKSQKHVPTGAHGSSGEAHHWTFCTWLPFFLHLSFSQPSLLGKLEIGVNVYILSHAARCHCLPVYLQNHRRKKGRRL